MLFMTAKVLMGGGSRNDRERVANCWGLTGPEMRPHWQRVRDDVRRLDIVDLQHAVVNCGTEYFRLDAQRAFKLAFWLFVFWVGAAVSFWWVVL